MKNELTGDFITDHPLATGFLGICLIRFLNAMETPKNPKEIWEENELQKRKEYRLLQLQKEFPPNENIFLLNMVDKITNRKNIDPFVMEFEELVRELVKGFNENISSCWVGPEKIDTTQDYTRQVEYIIKWWYQSDEFKKLYSQMIEQKYYERW